MTAEITANGRVLVGQRLTERVDTWLRRLGADAGRDEPGELHIHQTAPRLLDHLCKPTELRGAEPQGLPTVAHLEAPAPVSPGADLGGEEGVLVGTELHREIAVSHPQAAGGSGADESIAGNPGEAGRSRHRWNSFRFERRCGVPTWKYIVPHAQAQPLIQLASASSASVLPALLVEGQQIRFRAGTRVQQVAAILECQARHRRELVGGDPDVSESNRQLEIAIQRFHRSDQHP
jgi:hypothetical protein